MKLYMPHTLCNSKAKMIWFTSACPRDVKAREAAHKGYRSHPSAETHALYISSRNQAKSILKINKNGFINRKCQNLSNFNSSFFFWHLTNIIPNNITSSSFPPLLQPDGFTAVSSFSKAELFAQTFATNSILDDTRYIPPTPPRSDYFIRKIQILHYDVFHALSGLDSRKTYGSNGVSSVVLKNCAFELVPSLVKLFRLCLSTSTYPILQTTTL